MNFTVNFNDVCLHIKCNKKNFCKLNIDKQIQTTCRPTWTMTCGGPTEDYWARNHYISKAFYFCLIGLQTFLTQKQVSQSEKNSTILACMYVCMYSTK